MQSKVGGGESRGSSGGLVITVLAITRARKGRHAVIETAIPSSPVLGVNENRGLPGGPSAATVMRGRENGQGVAKDATVSSAIPKAICRAAEGGGATKRKVAVAISRFGPTVGGDPRVSVVRKIARQAGVGPAEATTEGPQKGRGLLSLRRTKDAASGRREASGGRGLSMRIRRRLRLTRVALAITPLLEARPHAITAGADGQVVICGGHGLGLSATARVMHCTVTPVITADCH